VYNYDYGIQAFLTFGTVVYMDNVDNVRIRLCTVSAVRETLTSEYGIGLQVNPGAC